MLFVLSVGHIALGSEVDWARTKGSHGPPGLPPGEHWAAGMLSPLEGAIRPVPIGIVGAAVGRGAKEDGTKGMGDRAPPGIPGIILATDDGVANGKTGNIDDGTAAAGGESGLDAGAAGDDIAAGGESGLGAGLHAGDATGAAGTAGAMDDSTGTGGAGGAGAAEP